MDSLDQRLVAIVEKLLDEHRELIVESELQQQALIEGDTATLDDIVQRLTRRVERIQSLELERIDVSEQIATRFDVEASGVTVSFLQGKMDVGCFARLRKASQELSDVLLELTQLHEQNNQLLQQSLRFITKTIDLVATSLDSGNYGVNKQKRGSGGHIFDVKA